MSIKFKLEIGKETHLMHCSIVKRMQISKQMCQFSKLDMTQLKGNTHQILCKYEYQIVMALFDKRATSSSIRVGQLQKRGKDCVHLFAFDMRSTENAG